MPSGGTTPERGRAPATTRQQAGAAAAIDIGTNSVLLLIAVRDEATGAPRPLLERATITRLGEGVDKTRQLAAPAVQRTLECLRGYAADMRAHGVTRLAVVGTSALRDAAGGEAFLNAAQQILGERPRVIAGDEEAALTFRGALSGLEVSGDLLVFDIGGGSTELIAGSASSAGTPASRVSLDIGSVRLFERHVHSDPPTPSELAAIQADVARELAMAAPLALTRSQRRPTLVGVAGTVTTL